MLGRIEISNDRITWIPRWAELQRLYIHYPQPPSSLPLAHGVVIDTPSSSSSSSTPATPSSSSLSSSRLDLTELSSVTINGGNDHELLLTFRAPATSSISSSSVSVSNNIYIRTSDIRERDCWLESLSAICLPHRLSSLPLTISSPLLRVSTASLIWLQTNPSSIEGPFRESGDRRATAELWHAFAVESLSLSSLPSTAPVIDGRIAADLFKGVLRRLPESLLTNQLFTQFRAASQMSSADQLISLTQRLPAVNRRILLLLFQSLSSLVSSPISRLDSHNITTLLSPGLLPDDDPNSLRDIGKTQALLFFFQTFIAAPQLLEGKSSAGNGNNGNNGNGAPLSSSNPTAIGLGLTPMAMSPMNNGSSVPSSSPSPTGNGLTMPPLMVTTSLTSPTSSTPLTSTTATAATAGGSDIMALTLPVDAEKNVKLIKRGTKQIIIAHQYEWVRDEEFANFATELAELEKHHSPQLELALRSLSSSLHAAEAHRLEVTAQLQKHIVNVARESPPQLKDYRTATSKRATATKSVHQKERALNQARQKNAKNIDTKAGDLERETLKLKQAERDMLQQEALRLARMKEMLRAYVENHVYLYSRTIETLSSSYASCQQISPADDAKNIVSHLVSLQDYPPLD